MPKEKLDWRIRYLGRVYHIAKWRNVYIIELDEEKSHRVSKAKQLRKLIDMRGSGGFGMKPGEFIFKITGVKCDDLS